MSAFERQGYQKDTDTSYTGGEASDLTWSRQCFRWPSQLLKEIAIRPPRDRYTYILVLGLGYILYSCAMIVHATAAYQVSTHGVRNPAP